MVSALASHARGHRFESYYLHQNLQADLLSACFFLRDRNSNAMTASRDLANNFFFMTYYSPQRVSQYKYIFNFLNFAVLTFYSKKLII